MVYVYLDKLFSVVHRDIMLAIRESFPNGEQLRKSEICQPNADDRKFLMNRNYFSGSFNHQQLPEWLIEKYFQSQQQDIRVPKNRQRRPFKYYPPSNNKPKESIDEGHSEVTYVKFYIMNRQPMPINPTIRGLWN